MTQQELRIGCRVLCNDKPIIISGIIVTAHGCRVYDESSNDWSLSRLSPIPLTEELLLKCGFDIRENVEGAYGKTYGVHYSLDYVYCIQRDWRELPSYFFGIECTDSPFPEDENRLRNVSYEVKYVHQLQNIIHALKGEEIEITL